MLQTCSSSRRYIWFQSISQLLKVKKQLKKYSSSSGNFSRWVNHQKLVQLSPFQASCASKSKENNNLCCRISPKFSMDVSRNKSAIQLQPVNVCWRFQWLFQEVNLIGTILFLQYQLINWSKGYTMASIQDQLQCCLLLPRTRNKTKHQNQHTHEIQDGDGRSTVGVNTKTKGRLFQLIRILQRKIGVSGNWNCHQSVKVSR